MAYEKCTEVHSDTQNQQKLSQETHQDIQDQQHNCCDIDCCDTSCTCANGSCQSAVYLFEQINSSIQANAPNRFNLVSLVQFPSYSTLPFRPPILTS
ncbi:hypothetical protein [Catenovulum agarivorans]|nr:hypothetical protein [Catenovulum agarivorans]